MWRKLDRGLAVEKPFSYTFYVLHVIDCIPVFSLCCSIKSILRLFTWTYFEALHSPFVPKRAYFIDITLLLSGILRGKAQH